MIVKRLLPVLLSAVVLNTNTVVSAADIDLSLYPPLSTGEASPWEKPEPKKKVVPTPRMNVWSPQAPMMPFSGYNGMGGMPQYRPGVMPPRYTQPMIPQPYQPGIQAPGYYQNMPMPVIPQGQYVQPYNGQGYGFNNMPWFNNGRNNNNDPFDFSMPWPF